MARPDCRHLTHDVDDDDDDGDDENGDSDDENFNGGMQMRTGMLLLGQR